MDKSHFFNHERKPLKIFGGKFSVFGNAFSRSPMASEYFIVSFWVDRLVARSWKPNQN